MTIEPVPRKRGRPRKEASAKAAGQFKLSRAGLHERAFDRLRTMIVRGKLAPETPLVETDLCEMLGVSRTPLREALKLLAAQELVELRQNRSARIAPMRIDTIHDLFEAMSGLERLTAELAAKRMTEADLAELRRLQDEMERHEAAGDMDGYFTINQQIHSAIVAGAGNVTLRETHEWLLARAERARFFALSSLRRWEESIGEHRAILAALEGRQAETAGRLLAEHVQHTGREVVQILANHPTFAGVAA